MPSFAMRFNDRTGLAILLNLVALTLFDAMGLVIKHLSVSYSAAELAAWRNLFGVFPTLIALIGVSARMMDDDVPSALVNLYASMVALVGSFAIALVFGGFAPIRSGTDLAWIVAMGGFGGTAVLCLVVSYRMTEQSNLAPFSYFGIPLAFLLGWLFF